MTEFNVFIENTYEKSEIDEVVLYNDTVKMTKELFSDKKIKENFCLKGVKYSSVSFDIVLTDNEEIHRINREYRHKDSPTDVITFAVFADSPENERFILDGDVNLGEIIVSIDRIKEQAAENNNTFKEELYYIISHGILHLAGFDHLTEQDYDFMVEKQNKVKASVL